MSLSTKRMKPFVVLAASLLIAITPGSAQAPVTSCHGKKTVCQALVNGEQELASMLVSGDTDVVRRLFADDAIWTLASGTRWTKQAALAALRNAPKMSSSRLVQASVYQHGRVAVVTWNESWRDPADAREHQAFGTDTWMKRGTTWQIIASQEARYPPAR